MLLTCFCCVQDRRVSPTLAHTYEPIAIVYTPVAFPIKATLPSVFEVESELNFDAVLALPKSKDTYTGTAWTIATDREYSILATAGHVCHHKGETNPDESDKLKRPIASVSTVIDVGDEQIRAEILYDDDTRESDLCLLKAHFSSPALQLAQHEPEPGDPVFYVGFPAQAHTIQTGYYVDVTPDGLQNQGMEAFGGASGSPVLDLQGHVYGVLVRVNMFFNGASYAIRLETVRQLYPMALASLRSN